MPNADWASTAFGTVLSVFQGLVLLIPQLCEADYLSHMPTECLNWDFDS